MAERLRILSYNIHKGFTVGNTRFVLREIKEGIRKVGADLVFLQEVQGEHQRHAKSIDGWPDASQFEFLADEVWSHFAYGKNAVYDDGHHGNAILSKFPIVSWSNIDVSTNRLERRGILHAAVQSPEWKRPVHCLCLHFNMLKKGRSLQVTKLSEGITRDVPPDDRMVIAGDFNDWTDLATALLKDEHEVEDVFRVHTGKPARTYPAALPMLKLDRIYVRGLKIVSAECLSGKPWSGLSDHVPLMAEVEL